MIYKAHIGPVRCIKWYDDDSGFISGGWDGNVYFWNLYSDKKDPNDINPRPPYSLKNQQFASVANKPDSKTIAYVAGVDKTIRTIQGQQCLLTYEAGVNISQI
jgi:WD40 repeat protein